MSVVSVAVSDVGVVGFVSELGLVVPSVPELVWPLSVSTSIATGSGLKQPLALRTPTANTISMGREAMGSRYGSDALACNDSALSEVLKPATAVDIEGSEAGVAYVRDARSTQTWSRAGSDARDDPG